jgi:hypothetical protein
MGETIDDAFASRHTVPGSLEPFEGEGRTGTVTQESFETSSVVGRDVDRGIDAEPTEGLPSEHVIGDVALKQTVAVEGTVSRAIPTEAAMPRLDSPPEAAKTILARSTCRRGSVRDRTQDSRIRRSPRRSRNFFVVVAMDTKKGVHSIVG